MICDSNDNDDAAAAGAAAAAAVIGTKSYISKVATTARKTEFSHDKRWGCVAEYPEQIAWLAKLIYTTSCMNDFPCNVEREKT